MHQVDAGIEDTAAGMLRMLDYAAAQDADFDAIVEKCEIDRRFKVGRPCDRLRR
jgi:hypothetical protein